MRLLVLLTDAFGGHGGIAKFNRDLLTALASFPETEAVVALPRLVVQSVGHLPEKIIFDCSGLGSKWRYFFCALRSLFTGGTFQCVVCAHINLLWLAWLYARWRRIPLILVIHGVEAWRYDGRWLTRRLLGQVDRILAVSEFTKNRFVSWSKVQPARVMILPNSIDIASFQPGPRRSDLVKRYGLEGKKVILTLARLDAQERYKGIDELLEVLPKILSNIANLKYLIVGDGSDRQRLESKAQFLGVGEHVVFTGRVSEAEKVDHYRLADLFVMAGFGEGFGIVYLEALACGVPVVGSVRDASQEALRQGRLGVLVDPCDAESLRNGIVQSLLSPRLTERSELDYFSLPVFTHRLGKILAGIDLLSPCQIRSRALS